MISIPACLVPPIPHFLNVTPFHFGFSSYYVGEIRNANIEIRNKSEMDNENVSNPEILFGICLFECVSDFEFKISLKSFI